MPLREGAIANVVCTTELLRTVFEETLDQKLRVLRQTLLNDLACTQQRHQKCSSELTGEDKVEPQKSSNSNNSNHTAELNDVDLEIEEVKKSGRPPAVLTDLDPDSGSLAGLNSPRTPNSWKRISSVREGMRTLSEIGGPPASVAKDTVDKMVIRNDLASLRKQKLAYDKAVVERLVSCVTWWHHLEEPERTGVMANIVKSRRFELFCISVIFVNSAFLAIGADWEIRHIGEEKPSGFIVSECACMVVFLTELLMRMSVHRIYFFVNNEMKMNCFDFLIVTLGTFDLVLFFSVQDAANNTNDNFVLARIFRLMKLAKMFRTVRALRFFKDIVVILEGVKNSLAALLWIFIMLGMMLFICGLVFLQGMIDYLDQNENLPTVQVEKINRYFGSLWSSILSLYCAVTGGEDWRVYYELVADVGPLYSCMFVAFTFFFLFAMFNILTGLFVEKAAVAAKPDDEEIIMSQNKKAGIIANELKKICDLLDADRSGCISWKEFQRMMSNPTVVAYMASIGLEVHEPELFFAMISDSLDDLEEGNSTHVPIPIFVDRCMQLKGTATSIDSQRHLYELHQMKHMMSSLSEDVQGLSSKLRRLMLSSAIDGLTPSLLKQPMAFRSAKLSL